MAQTKEQIAAAKLAADNAKIEADKLAVEQKAADEKAAADKAAAEAAKAKEPTSEALTKLQSDLSAAKKVAATAPEDSKEQDAAFDNVYKIKEAIKVEIANIRREEAAAEAKERQAKIAKQADDFAEAYHQNQLAVGNEGLSLDEKNALNKTYQDIREIIVNKLLGTAPKVKSDGSTIITTGDAKGETSTEILRLITENRAKGMNDADNKKAVVDAGHKVGTIWGILDKFKKEHGALA